MSEFLRVTEIFHSIQGESTWAGYPCTFIRLTGCPLRCTWCDTAYSFYGGERRTLDELVAKCEEIGTRLVEITGGEPLIHRNAFMLTSMLLDRGYTVLVETSGAVDVAPLDPRAHKIMDLKCPVIKDRADYEWARAVVFERGLADRKQRGELREILFSPVWDSVQFPELAQWILEDRLPVRYQIQLHKVIWGANVAGV